MSWNRQSDRALERPRETESSSLALKKAASLGVLLISLLLINHFRDWIPQYISSEKASWFSYGLGTFLSLAILSQLIQAVPSSKEQSLAKGLTHRQKVLFGLPAGPSGSAGTVKAVEPAKHTLSGSIGPPLRSRRLLTPVADNGGGGGMQTPRTPGSEGSGRRTASPYSEHPPVTTPEQLQQYLNRFESASRESSPATGGPGDHGFTGASQPFTSSTEGVQPYRPSLQARGKTGSPLRVDGILYPSSQETFEAVLAQLQTDATTLEAWIDRFRQWLASEVAKPLLVSVQTAHTEVAQSAAQLGLNGVELSDLSKTASTSSNRGLQADEEAQINGLRAQLQNQLQQPMQEQQRKAVLACLQAVKKYQKLDLLLRGESPRNVIGPVPRGYIASRLHTLAEGSCLAEFTWNSGGSWQNKPWTHELLTDSALIFYLFAGFLEAPFWQFLLDDRASPATTVPLYIGNLPTRPAQHCSALLPVRPASLPSRAAAVLALSLPSNEPSFTLVMNGQPALTVSSYIAVFTQMLLLLRYNQLHNFGMLGGSSLDFLKLSPVLRHSQRSSALAKLAWFSLW